MNLITKMPLRMVEILLESHAGDGSAIWSIEATMDDPRLTRALRLNAEGGDVVTPGPNSETTCL